MELSASYPSQMLSKRSGFLRQGSNAARGLKGGLIQPTRVKQSGTWAGSYNKDVTIFNCTTATQQPNTLICRSIWWLFVTPSLIANVCKTPFCFNFPHTHSLHTLSTRLRGEDYSNSKRLRQRLYWSLPIPDQALQSAVCSCRTRGMQAAERTHKWA